MWKWLLQLDPNSMGIWKVFNSIIGPRLLNFAKKNCFPYFAHTQNTSNNSANLPKQCTRTTRWSKLLKCFKLLNPQNETVYLVFPRAVTTRTLFFKRKNLSIFHHLRNYSVFNKLCYNFEYWANNLLKCWKKKTILIYLYPKLRNTNTAFIIIFQEKQESTKTCLIHNLRGGI